MVYTTKLWTFLKIMLLLFNVVFKLSDKETLYLIF